MKDSWVLSGVGDRVQQLTLRRAGDPKRHVVRPVLTTRDDCARLQKSRRQLYRCLRTERLRRCARVWDQWLFAKSEVDRFVRSAIPSTLRRFFWDVPFSSLSSDRHRDFILGRILEFGDRGAVHWAFRAYSRAEVAAFLMGRGADVLSKRTWHFWVMQLGVKPGRRGKRSWRFRGRAWGGVS